MPLPTAYGTVPIGGALPEAYIDPFIPISTTDGANNLPTGYGVLIPAVSMTAAASGSSGITVADDDDIDFGTGDFSIHWEGALPDWDDGSTQRLWYKYQSSAIRGGANVISGGLMNCFFRDSSGNLISESSAASVETILSPNQNAKLTYVCTRETASADGSVAFYINGALFDTQGIPAAATVSISNSGNGNISCSGTDGTGRLASTTRALYLYNRALSAAEVLSLCNNGVAAADVGASQSPKITYTFTNSTDSFTGVSGATVTAVDAIFAVDDVLRISSDGSANARARRSNAGATLYFNTRFSFSAARPAANTTCTGLRLAITTDGADTITASQDFQITSADAWQAFESATFVLPTEATGRRIAIYPITAAGVTQVTSGDIVYVDTLSTYQLGNILALAPTGLAASGLTWTDSSGNGNNGTLPASGATKVTIRK